ncbi:MAG: hypothetical protein IPL79_04845 [Myxococcales bacterium]|nr:hypothetical protein [Myxococcales bacterium]
MNKFLQLQLCGMLMVACALHGGCGARQGGPGGAIASYRRALERGKFSVAYDMMSAEYRARVSENEFVELMKASPTDVAATVKELGGSFSTAERATFRYGVGESIELIVEQGQWRLAHDPSQLYDQSTPHAAVRAFARAYRFSKWDVMLRLVPLPYRDAMSVETVKAQFTGEQKNQMDTLVELLETAPIEGVAVDGAEATLSLGLAGTVRLVREADGRWCLRDIQ